METPGQARDLLDIIALNLNRMALAKLARHEIQVTLFRENNLDLC